MFRMRFHLRYSAALNPSTRLSVKWKSKLSCKVLLFHNLPFLVVEDRRRLPYRLRCPIDLGHRPCRRYRVTGDKITIMQMLPTNRTNPFILIMNRKTRTTNTTTAPVLSRANSKSLRRLPISGISERRPKRRRRLLPKPVFLTHRRP